MTERESGGASCTFVYTKRYGPTGKVCGKPERDHCPARKQDSPEEEHANGCRSGSIVFRPQRQMVHHTFHRGDPMTERNEGGSDLALSQRIDALGDMRKRIDSLLQPESERECKACGHAASHAEGGCWHEEKVRGDLHICPCNEWERVLADVLTELDAAGETKRWLTRRFNTLLEFARVGDVPAKAVFDILANGTTFVAPAYLDLLGAENAELRKREALLTKRVEELERDRAARIAAGPHPLNGGATSND